MDWTPTISDRQGPIYQRILNALADDIAAGRLHQGQALPTHRALANALGVDLTTVTRAYAEARRQGLTDAKVGRGTFVKARASALPRAASPGIDLSMNLPPHPPEADLDGRLAKTLSDIRSEAGFSAYLTYQQPGGTLTERQVAAEWLQSLVPGTTSDRLVLAPGTQTALFCLLLALAGRGDEILTERLTYPGLKAAAAALGLRLIGIDMDAEGIAPVTLERAARQHKDAKVVYLMPTIHNPTTATMSEERRIRIAEIIRKRGLTLIEDDPYSLLTRGVTPVSSLIPERSYFCASLSKCIAPGFRTSLVVTPESTAASRLTGLLRATLQMPAPLMTAVATRWMRDGTANAIIEAVRAEAAIRQSLARQALAGQQFAAHPNGHHVWLTLHPSWPVDRFAAELRGRGLAIVTGEAFAAGDTSANAIRIALGAARSRAQLVKALDILADALNARAPDKQVV
ncbi:PLP-dependent aminotransferase family protein [Hyphomicrobium sp.]|uniref:aminotransferase-like domain-containing protein n=1 Tax=Hyphomicrobium sp. TaxID=82 RepID=UPI002E32075B|nr:PLP-dependent aminotransferase family protein [Hyphomicrobium sp.]HEX2843091.1 PLP-dependent aminotransferase family protein [Hyphomicrobium sp.]